MTESSVHAYASPTAHSRRPAAVRRTRPPHLRVVTARPARAPRLPFSVVVVALLASGLVGLLALNTASAESAFRQHRLQARVAVLADRQQALQITLDAQAAPQALAARAERLGMRPSPVARYLRVPDRSAGVVNVPPPQVPPRCQRHGPAGPACATAW